MGKLFRRKRKPKDIYELKSHSARRLEERYGFENGVETAEKITQSIRNYEAKFLWRESKSRTHWLVEVDGRNVIAVYNKNVKFICTVLPEDVLSVYGDNVQILREQD